MVDWTHSFNQPVTIHTALGTLDAWSTANVDNQSLSRSVWQDLTAIRGHDHIIPTDEKGPGRQIVFPGALRQNLVDYIVNNQTDFLQMHCHVAIAALQTLILVLLPCATFFASVAATTYSNFARRLGRSYLSQPHHLS